MPRAKKPGPGPAAVEFDDGIPTSERLAALAAVAGKFSKWKPGTEVLTSVKSQPTIFPGVDKATGIGGWPLQRVVVVHGPSSHGKTALMHGVGLSFLRAGSIYALIDAEHTTPKEWIQQLMGAEFASHPGFRALRPKTYEETSDAVRELLEGLATAKDKGELPSDTSALIVVDSIRKLLPQNLGKKLKAKGATVEGVDGMRGRAGQIRAKMNAEWLDELVPSLYHANASMTFISREYEAQTDPRDMPRQDAGIGMEFKVSGGKALVFEASLMCRVTRNWVYEGSKENKIVVGEKCTVRVEKTKVAGHEGKVTEGAFHISNGVRTPAGFDRARDVFELAVSEGAIQQTGAYYSDESGQRWHGSKAMIESMSKDPAYLLALEKKIRA